MTISIPLTKGYVAIVSDEDADLAALNWQVLIHKRSNSIYAQQNFRDVDNKRHTRMLHRVILSRVVGRTLLRSEDVDHIDLDGLNNRRDNLRLATRSQNKANVSIDPRNKSGFKGVGFDKRRNKWRARICVNYHKIQLGSFDTPELAYEAYCKAAQELFGEFARFE